MVFLFYDYVLKNICKTGLAVYKFYDAITDVITPGSTIREDYLDK